MKKRCFLGICLLALASQPVMAQTVKQEVVMVRAREWNGNAQLIIEQLGQAPEALVFKWVDSPGKDRSAAKGYLGALDKIFQQGYQLQTVIPGVSSTSVGGWIEANSTLVFTRVANK